THGAHFSDAQCGFKAARSEAVRPLLAVTKDDGWFFDTELLLLAEHNGLRIHEVPVDWVEDVDSKVHIVGTALQDLRGLSRMAWSKLSGAAVVPVPQRPEPVAEHPVVRSIAGPAQAAAAWRAKWELASYALIGGASIIGLALAYVLARASVPP